MMVKGVLRSLDVVIVVVSNLLSSLFLKDKTYNKKPPLKNGGFFVLSWQYKYLLLTGFYD